MSIISDGSDGAYASEEETLSFANKVREAGGGDLIDSLLPSHAHDVNACLIANALNFSCSILPAKINLYGNLADDEWAWNWYMIPPNDELAERIGKALDLPVETKFLAGSLYSRKPTTVYCEERRAIKLPREIGNVAHAFDEGIGWTLKYAD